MNKAGKIIAAAEHIKRVCRGDIIGQAVMAAFAQDAIDHEDTMDPKAGENRT